MKNIIIYGGAGFIGSNAVNFFCKKNYNILVLDKLTYAGNKINISNLINKKKIKFIKGDICNLDLLNKVNLSFKPNYILNFAAESHVDKSISDPDLFFNSNTKGVYKILESIKFYKRKFGGNFKFIHVSTDEVFGSINRGSFRETSQYQPSSPYSATKAASDVLVKGWCKTYDINYNITNCTNNFGPYQFPEKLIPLTLFRSLNNLPIQIYGDGKNIRDWIYVNDHIRYIYEIMKNGIPNSTYNISTKNELSNNSLINKLFEVLAKFKAKGHINAFSKNIEFVIDRPAHDFRYSVNIQKLNQLNLNFKPSSFEKALHETVRWYLSNPQWLKKTLKRSNYDGSRLGLQ